MELKQLIYFRKLAQSQNISHAAKELYITQQALSKSLVQLEEELNIRLFYRTTRHIELTEAGKKLLTYAEQIINQVDEIPYMLKGLSEPILHTWSIGIADGIQGKHGGILTLSQFNEVARCFSDTKIILSDQHNSECVNNLISHRFDGAIVISQMDCDIFQHIYLTHTELLCMVPVDHPYANNCSISIDELSKEHILLPFGDENRSFICQYFLDNYYPVPQKEHFLTLQCNLFTINEHVIAGEGIALIPSAIKPYIESDQVRLLPLSPAMNLTIRFCYRHDHPYASELEKYACLLRKTIEQSE